MLGPRHKKEGNVARAAAAAAGEPTGGQTERSETQEWCPLCNDRRARRPGRVMGIISLVPIFFHDTEARRAPSAVSGKQHLKPNFPIKNTCPNPYKSPGVCIVLSRTACALGELHDE